MQRSTFLLLSSPVALLVGAIAVAAPAAFLAGKGVAPLPATIVWMREVGVLIFAQGLLGLLLRRAPDSDAVRAFLGVSALVQLGLLPIEILAYRDGVITELAGVAPNSVLHVVLASGFALFWRRAA